MRGVFRRSFLKGLDFLCCSTRLAKRQTSSKAEYCWCSTTLDYLGSRLPKYLTMVLVLTLLYVTLNMEFLKLPCVFFNTHIAFVGGCGVWSNCLNVESEGGTDL